jgi:diketogulonate reductase-like aldo/keto reductase
MNCKPLGQTGVLVPEIGLGTWDYHGGIEPLRAGLEAGALFVDTAESYGSEPVVGQAVAGLRKKVFLATKVSPEHFRFDDVLKAADASLQRLGVQHIDLYQLHAPSRSVPIAETLGAMEKLVDDGKVRFIGVSNFSVNELKTAQHALRKHRIVSNQVRYNLVDRTIEKDLLAYCQANRITVIAYSPLGRELQRIRDCDPKGILNEIARATGKTVPQVVLNWCLCRKDVVVIPKGNSVQHVFENCGASGWWLNAGQLQRLNEGVQFRRRSRAELALRRILPRALGPSLKRCIKLLPPALRRHVR